MAIILHEKLTLSETKAESIVQQPVCLEIVNYFTVMKKHEILKDW